MQTPTIETLKAAVGAAGDTVSQAWEDETDMYAAGTKSTGPATYQHPLNEAHFSKATGYLKFPGSKAVIVVAN